MIWWRKASRAIEAVPLEAAVEQALARVAAQHAELAAQVPARDPLLGRPKSRLRFNPYRV